MLSNYIKDLKNDFFKHLFEFKNNFFNFYMKYTVHIVKNQ
jgi:hypothetical protein